MGRRAKGEWAIYKRKDGLWVAESMAGGRKKYLYAKTKKAASEKKKAYEEKQAQSEPSRQDIEVEEFFNEWISSIEGTVKERTYQRHEEVVRLHLGSLYGKNLAEIKPGDLQRLYKGKLKGLSPRTVEIIHRTISKALKQAVRWDLVDRNVAEDVTPPKAQPKEIRTLTKEEVSRLFKIVKGSRFEAVYVLAITTGMREGDLWPEVGRRGSGVRAAKG